MKAFRAEYPRFLRLCRYFWTIFGGVLFLTYASFPSQFGLFLDRTVSCKLNDLNIVYVLGTMATFYWTEKAILSISTLASFFRVLLET